MAKSTLNHPFVAFKVKLIAAIDSWCPKTLVTIPNICKMTKNLKNSIFVFRVLDNSFRQFLEFEQEFCLGLLVCWKC